jgi:hypothetical protein
MNACCKNGSLAFAVLPSEELSVGTSRQPRIVWPSDFAICSNASRPFWRVAASGEP